MSTSGRCSRFPSWFRTRNSMTSTVGSALPDGRPKSTTRVGTTAPTRLYCESARAGTGALDASAGRVVVPTGHAVYPGELLQTPRVWAEKRYRLVHYAVQDRGGHFAAFEQPQLFAAGLGVYADVLRELRVM